MKPWTEATELARSGSGLLTAQPEKELSPRAAGEQGPGGSSREQDLGFRIPPSLQAEPWPSEVGESSELES